MHKILFRQAGFIRAFITTLLLVFASQTFAAANMLCESMPDRHAEHSQMIMADMNEPVAMAEALDCCAPIDCDMTGCDMANCALMLPATPLLVVDPPDQPYLIASDALQSELTATLLRPPIRF